MTFAGDFNHGDEYALSFNGITKTITASNADQYEDNAKGLAAQMAAAFDTDMHTADTAREAGTISSTQLKLTGTSVTDNGDGTITFAQDTNPQLTASVNHSDNAQTIAVSGSVITITSVGASVVSDRYDITINGEAISYTATANDGFDHTKVAGGAAGLAQAINANTDLNLAGYSATSSGGAVTIARTAKDIVDISTTATGGKATLTEAAGVFTVGGNIDNTDKFSMVIDGVTVEATISTSDGFSDTTTGAAQQIAQAINDANVPGVKAKFNNNATFTLERSGSLSLSNTANSQLSVEFIDAAIQTVNSQRAALGSISNRLDSTVSNLTNISANLTAGRGRIEDADFAAETTNLAKSQILQQASTAMLAQANASKQGVLSLLQG
jgi:flagellin